VKREVGVGLSARKSHECYIYIYILKTFLQVQAGAKPGAELFGEVTQREEKKGMKVRGKMCRREQGKCWVWNTLTGLETQQRKGKRVLVLGALVNINARLKQVKKQTEIFLYFR
jgi:hypothetical protein